MSILIVAWRCRKAVISARCTTELCIGAVWQKRDIDSFDDYDNRCSFCSLLPVPPHGRLIDADAMQAEWFNLNFDRKISDDTIAYWNYRLSQMPTIIPAEESKER